MLDSRFPSVVCLSCCVCSMPHGIILLYICPAEQYMDIRWKSKKDEKDVKRYEKIENFTILNHDGHILYLLAPKTYPISCLHAANTP